MRQSGTICFDQLFAVAERPIERILHLLEACRKGMLRGKPVIETGGGSIVNVASVAGLMGIAHRPAHSLVG